MLYYWLHILYLYIGSRFFWKKQEVTTDISRRHRVNILDCDSMKYMANSRYLQYMDFIRFEKMFRSPLYENTAKKGMFGVLGSQKIIYKRPMKIGSTFTITLVLEAWDEKWFYHKQIFEQQDELCAIGYTKAAFWKNKKLQNLASIFEQCGIAEKTREIPPEVALLFDADYELVKNKNNFYKNKLNKNLKTK